MKKRAKSAKTSGLRKFVKAAKKKAGRKPAARHEPKPKPGAAGVAKPKLQSLAPALGAFVADTGSANVLKLKQGGLTPGEHKQLLRLAPRPADTRWPSEIRIGNRYRREMGDLDSLARSIERRTRDGKPGLLQPIGVTPKDELIWGERRLTAWARSAVRLTHPIPVRVVDVSVIEGEWIENDPALRQNFTHSEAVEIMRAMKPKLREQLGLDAAARDTASRPAPGRKAGPGAAGGRVADKVAKMTGRSRNTLAKAEAVVEAAEREPAKYAGLVADMDRGGVDGPFRRLQIMQATDAIKAAPPALPDDPIAVVTIDPPWPFEGEAGQDEIDAAGRSLRPYPAMSIKALGAFMRDEVSPRLAPDVAVWLWVTNHHLIRGYAHHVIAALGFEGRAASMLTWVKDRIGRGAVLRDRTEHCILLTRGKPVINVLGADPPTTVLEAPRRDNSQKPEAFYRLVERVTPATRYVSIFSTGGEGALWTGYGDQVGKHAPAAAGDEREEWKALGAIEGGVTIEGPIVAVLRERKLVDAVDGKLALTIAGVDRLGALDAQFAAEKSAAPPAPKRRKRREERGPAAPPRKPDEALIDAAVKAGHVVSMTIDHVDASTSYSVATCQCKWTNRVRRTLDSHRAQDEAIEAHWCEVLQWKQFSTDRPAADPAAGYPDPPDFLRIKSEAAE